MKKTTDPVLPIPATEVARVRQEAAALSSPVLNTVKAISITNQATYDSADSALDVIRKTRKAVADKFGIIISPLYQSLQLLYKWREEVDQPLEQGEKFVKTKMAEWHSTERKRKWEEEQAKEEEARKIREELSRKQARADAATRASVKTVLTKATTELTQQLVEVESRPEMALPTGGHSSSRVTKKAVLVDKMAFLKAVVAGEIPSEYVTVDLLKAYRASPATVASWPGVKIEEEVKIVGR